MSYISNTAKDQKEMLASIGIKSGKMEDLFKGIPRQLRALSFDLPPGKSEYEVVEYFKGLAAKNATNTSTFVGGGFYDHYIPAAVDAIVSRSEFCDDGFADHRQKQDHNGRRCQPHIPQDDAVLYQQSFH